MNILGKNKKLSFEGEGTRIGLKTLLFGYPGEEEIKPDNKTWAIYVSTEKLDDTLLKFLTFWGKNKLITVETAQDISIPYRMVLNTLFFRVVTEYDPEFTLMADDLIKIRITKEEDMGKLIGVANKYCEVEKRYWNRVLLMPEFGTKNLGKKMVKMFDKLHPGVRFMPPVQDVLNIP